MHPRAAIPETLARLMTVQAGAVTVDQCRRSGMSREAVLRQVRDGHWTRVARGVLNTRPGTPAVETAQWAALLAAGQGAALGFETAGQAWSWCPAPPQPHVLVPHDHRDVAQGSWTVHRTRTPFRDVGEPARTTPERTLLDLCAQRPDDMLALVTTAMNSRRTTPGHVRRELARFSRFPRRRFLLDLLDDTSDGALSVLEVMYLRDVERAHCLPRGRRQSGSAAGLRDVSYGPLLVELDGRLGHVGRGAFRDMNRDNVHLLRGEHTLRFGFHDVDRRPCTVAAMVASALRMVGGHLGPITCLRGCVESEALLDMAR